MTKLSVKLNSVIALIAAALFGTSSGADAQPTSTDDPTTLAHTLLKQHRYHAAAKYFEDALKTNPQSPDLYCELADCFSAQEFYNLALPKYLEAKKLAPDDQSYKLRVAVCLAQMQKFDDSNKEFDLIKFVKDKAADYYFSKALIQFAKEDYAAAIKNCKKALKADKANKSATLELASAYSQIQQYSKAQNLLTHELKRNPQNLDLLSESGWLKTYENKPSEALKIFDKMISIDPNRIDPYCCKGYCYQQLDDWKKALECYKQVTGLSAGDPTVSKYIYPLLLQHDEFDLTASYVTFSFRQTPDTETVAKEATKAVVELPTNLKKKILTDNFWIIISPTILDFDPSISIHRPRGYPEGLTWENAAGYHDGKNIVICERFKKPDGTLTLNADAYFSTLHELGHAFDASQESLSNSEQFKYCYSLDCQGLSDKDKKWYAYYLQPDKDGRCELFASLFELYVCRLVGRTEREKTLSLRFPHCYDFVFRKLE